MELIKKIKEAETQGLELIAKAKSQAVKDAEENRKSCLDTQAEAEQKRKNAIDASVTAAKSEALSEIENLKAKAQQDRGQLHEKTSGKMASAVAKVMDYLKG